MFQISNDDEESFDEYLEEDLPYSMLSLLKQWCKTENFKDALNYALQRASDYRAYKCVNKIIVFAKSTNNEIEHSKIDNLIKISADRFDAQMVLLLEKNNFFAAAKRLFDPHVTDSMDDHSKSQLNACLLTMLRFLPIATVDQLVQAYIKENNANQADVLETYQKAKEFFHSKAPYFSRYTKAKDISNLNMAYQNDECSDLKSVAEKDFKYGEERENFTKDLYQKLDKTPIENYIPTKKKFLELPASSKGTQRAAALLEAISSWNHNKQKGQRDFSTIRSSGSCTPIANRYASASPLISSVSLFSPSKYVDKSGGVEGVYTLLYEISGKKIKLNDVIGSTKINERFRFWYHGQAPINDTWIKIEDLFEEIWTMNLKKPDENEVAGEHEKYKDKLTEFYAKTAELVWLIGNTQPMMRGSGTFAELTLNILHLRHELNPPVLKVEFPQLDVLDITFPVSDYTFFFTYFFEPSTIPEHLRFSDISSSLTLKQQMEALYKKMNKEDEFTSDHNSLNLRA